MGPIKSLESSSQPKNLAISRLNVSATSLILTKTVLIRYLFPTLHSPFDLGLRIRSSRITLYNWEEIHELYW
jgi:hypothetical protein